MVLGDLGTSLRTSLDKLRGKSRISRDDINEVIKDIQRSLIGADVDVELVMQLSDSIRERALKEEPPSGASASDHVLKIVYEELVNLIGQSADISLSPQKILLVGLQGSGKTTSAAKIAWWFSKKGLSSSIIQTDTFRPGAYEQTKQLAEAAEVLFYGLPDSKDPFNILKLGLEETSNTDIQIIDTAGRHALEDDLISELKQIEKQVNPDISLLIIDASLGQSAKKQARLFHEAIGIDGVVITKFDGTAKGGGALTAVHETNTCIAFIGAGETIRDIERFEPNGFISRLLGLGDLKQLTERLERAMQEFGEQDEEWDPMSILKGPFTLIDMRRQMRAMNQMGPLDQILDLIPSFGTNNSNKISSDAIALTQERLVIFDTIMDSMTVGELTNPRKIGASRITRISRGSGTSENEVRHLLSQHKTMEKGIKQMQGLGQGDFKRLMKKMQKGNSMDPLDFLK
jgi:signal recognition particle subunit SRP54